MKSPRDPFVDSVRALAAEAREKAAAKLFGLDALRLAVTGAAALGLDQVIIRPALPVDLTRTTAAAAAVKFFTDGGANTTWQQYTATDEHGHQVAGYELAISWGEARF